MASNGDYQLTANPSTTAYWYADDYDLGPIYEFYTAGTPLPYQNDLKVRACDVTNDGDVSSYDLGALYNRYTTGSDPNFLLPDFLFDTTFIQVSSAAVYQDILSICSGNVTGSNGSPNGY